ncbi:hypothetical protein BBJ28_00018810 [Nothophytophthora sp. Chile5]|nr:hypothetical protein BBJ28_00018810 [Nothophytophthora sp. Chile5]
MNRNVSCKRCHMREDWAGKACNQIWLQLVTTLRKRQAVRNPKLPTMKTARFTLALLLLQISVHTLEQEVDTMDDLPPWTEADDERVDLMEMDNQDEELAQVLQEEEEDEEVRRLEESNDEFDDFEPIEGIEDSPEQQRINVANWKAYLEEEHRRAEEQELAPQPQDDQEAATADEEADEETDEEEAVEDDPIIPGLSGVDLFAFNAEYANREVLETIIDWSYDQTAAASPYRDNFIHVNDLYEFLLKTLNPLNDDIDEEDHEILTDAVLELRKAQGLVDDDMIVYRGFIARGMPLRFLQSLAHKMHQTVQARRLQTSDRHQEL